MLEAQVRGLQRQEFLRGRYVLREGTYPDKAEDLVAGPEPRHFVADRLNIARHVAAENRVLRFAHSRSR